MNPALVVIMAVVVMGFYGWLMACAIQKIGKTMVDATDRTIEAVTRSMYGVFERPSVPGASEPHIERAEVYEQNPFAREDLDVSQKDIDAMAPWESDDRDPFSIQ